MSRDFFDYRPWKFALVWAVVFGVVLARIPDLWLSGEFIAEDAWVFFVGAFNSSWTQSVFMPYAGYFHILPRILAELISLFPYANQPHVYAMVGMSINALIFSLFYLPHFRHLMRSDMARAAVSLTLAVAQNSENMGFILGQHWYIAFLLPVLMVMQIPESKTGRFSLYASSVICIWSSPSNLVLAPFLLWSSIREKNTAKAKWSRFTLINLMVVALFIVLLRLRDAERTGEFMVTQVPAALNRLVLRGWLGTGLFGQFISEKLVTIQPFLLDFLGALTLCLIAVAIYRFRKTDIGKSCFLLIGSSILMIGLSMTRSLYLAELGEIQLPRHVRYLTGPTLLLNASALILIYQLVYEKKKFWFYGIWGVQCLFLTLGLGKLNHWSRPPGQFQFKNFVPAIELFEREYLNSGKDGELYIPSDVPYAGAVLRSGNGIQSNAEVSLQIDLKTTPFIDPSFGNWVQANSTKTTAQESKTGILTYDGYAEGRFWFRDEDNRLLFTSELLRPYLWRMDGLNFELIESF